MAKIGIGVPTHNVQLSVSTVQALLAAHRSVDGHFVSAQIVGLSLLARCFNTLFTDSYRRGDDFFVLLHADIGVSPPNGANKTWLDIAIERTEQLGAACLSYVSPIKSDAGHTSSGLFVEPGNLWSLRRLTMKQAHKLPRVAISREHVCMILGFDPAKAGALMVNTGCIIFNLRDFPWSEWPGFSIEDRIVWDPEKQPLLTTVPEDWNLSAWLHSKNWPYFLSRELTVDHAGLKMYNTNDIWGDAVDNAPVIFTPSEWERGVHLAAKSE